jgi:hypothetical protein
LGAYSHIAKARQQNHLSSIMIQLLFALICFLSRLQPPACSRSFVSFTSSPDRLRRTLHESMILVHALRTFRVAGTPSNDRAVCVHLEIDTSMPICCSCAQDSACSTSGTNGIAKARSLCTKSIVFSFILSLRTTIGRQKPRFNT